MANYIEILGYLPDKTDPEMSKLIPSLRRFSGPTLVAYKYELTDQDLAEIRKPGRWRVNWWLSSKIAGRSHHLTLSRFSNIRDFHAVIDTWSWEKSWHHRDNATEYNDRTSGLMANINAAYLRD